MILCPSFDEARKRDNALRRYVCTYDNITSSTKLGNHTSNQVFIKITKAFDRRNLGDSHNIDLMIVLSIFNEMKIHQDDQLITYEYKSSMFF